MSRTLFLDVAPGEVRAGVMVDGRPERLLIERDGDLTPRLGARYLGRVVALSQRMNLARLDLGFGVGAGQAAALRLAGPASLSQGATVVVEVTAEPARDKGAVVKLIQLAPAAEPQRLRPPPPILDRLRDLAPEAAVVVGAEARALADEAEAQALAREHSLPGGLTLTIEVTRALIAVDVDLAETGAPKAALQANLQALRHAGRLLRLKGLAGLIVIDLIGFSKEKARLQEAARTAFAPDGPEVAIAPLSRFGVLELSKPRREQPLGECLADGDGRLSARTLAQRLVRSLERQASFAPGAHAVAVCGPDVAKAISPLIQKLGPRFSICEEAGRDRFTSDIVLR